MNRVKKIGLVTIILPVIVSASVAVQKSEKKIAPKVTKKVPVHKIIMKCGEGKCGMSMMKIVPVKKK